MKRLKITQLFFILFLMMLMTEKVYASTNKTPLPSEQAFVFSASIQHVNDVRLKWHIAKGYYLYRDRLHISLIPKTEAEMVFPQGEIKKDPRHGQYEVYKDDLIIPILLQTSAKQVQLNVEYQGCSERGFCYPPIKKTTWLNLANQTISQTELGMQAPPSRVSLSSLMTSHNDVRALFATQHLSVILLIFAGLGLLLAFTPCVLPMVPILTSIIVGHKKAVSTKKAFLLSLTYVLGSALTYAIAGIIAASMGSSLQAWLQQPWIIAMASGLFVLLAFSLFDLYELRLPRAWQNRITLVSRKQEGGTYFGVFIMGIVSTLIVSPCVTAPLVGVLMYIAQTGDKVLGASALFAMGMGMGLPLILIGVSAGKLIPKRGPWMIAIKKLFGVLMLVMAVWLLSRVANSISIFVFCSVIVLGFSLYLCILPRRFGNQAWLRPLGYIASALSLLAILSGVTAPNMMNRWILAHQLTPSTHSFIIVHDMAELKKQISVAQSLHKPVMLDFYADWCESCVTMDKNVFSLPQVQQALNRFVLLRADLTANNPDDETILKNYNVIAPPTVLFFNNQGQEVNSHRIVGEVNEKEFTKRLNLFITASCDKKLQC